MAFLQLTFKLSPQLIKFSSHVFFDVWKPREIDSVLIVNKSIVSVTFENMDMRVTQEY